MDDLIRREDAINALYEWCETPNYDDAIGVIRKVQSAQQWIPVSERLPEENNFYLSTIYSKGMQTAFCDILFYGAPQLCEDRKIGWYFMHNGDMEQVFNVKAWMPLPEPFEGVEE